MTKSEIGEIVEAIVSHERFDTLFTTVAQLDTRVGNLERDVADLKESMRAMQASIDHLAKTVDTLLLEYAALKAQNERHERWFKQLADKVGIELAA